MSRPLAGAVVVLGLFAAACSRDIQSKEAVRQGVIDHLSGRQGLDLDLAAMTVDVTAVTFRENEAEATVSFQPKSGGGGMSMQYTLERQGNRWTVKTKAETGGSPHGEGGMGTAPQGELPPGHPPVQNQ